MKIESQLFEECKNRSLNCSITYQKINSYSVEIYTGYRKDYELIFYTDGHIEQRKAVRKALRYIRSHS